MNRIAEQVFFSVFFAIHLTPIEEGEFLLYIVLKKHLFQEHGFRLQCSGDMLHGICKDCENKSDQL